MKNVIYTLEAAGALECGNVLRGLHNAYHGFVPLVVGAYLAYLAVGEVLAAAAQLHSIPRADEIISKFLHLVGREIEHVVSKALRGLYTDTGQLCELLCGKRQRSGYKFRHSFSSI